MHWKDLRAIGENEQRPYSLDSWRECLYHTATRGKQAVQNNKNAAPG